MGEINNATTPESAVPSSLLSGKWIAKVILAVILAEAIWGFIVALTSSLILPALSRVMGADPQSPLYLGKGDFNVPAIFSSVLELCLAGITAVVLNQWSRSAPARARVKPVKTGAVAAKASMPSISPTGMPSILAAPESPVRANTPAVPQPRQPAPAPIAVAPTAPTPTAPGQFWSPPEPSPQPKASAPPAPPKAPTKPAKPKLPKEVYYNIVGEPINPTEDE